MEQTFGQALRELRRTKGLSQRRLAALVGVDFSYISKVENDRLPPPAADTIVRMCEALEAEATSLLSLTGKIPTDVRAMISSSPAAMRFARDAQSLDLTEGEWRELGRQLKRLRE